ncbi:MAG TPA: hypothetical protein VGO80_02700 [Solirubrobacteraceae bacterium]|nr:hypothetical protein [Solirubrobacteraceae bacterium]
MRAVLPIVVALLALVAAPAHAQSAEVASYVYEPCGAVGQASVVEVVGAPCADAQAAAAQVVAQPPAAAAGALLAAGWTLVRAQTTGGGDEHDLVATRPAAALRIRRSGSAPDIDGWEAGRELIFARKRLVGGRPVPSGAVVCTSSWLVRVAGGALGGLSAAHCGGLRSDRTVHRHNVVLRRPPQDGIVLGRVQRILTRSRPLDALLVPVPGGAGRTRVPLVDRGVLRPPWIVAGLAQPTAGRGVCFSGRTSGADLCGSIVSHGARAGERLVSAFAGVSVRCTSLRARQGDSGGPVYTAPGSDGRVRAVGIVTLVLLPSRQMCFTPLAPVLDGLRAKLVTSSG